MRKVIYVICVLLLLGCAAGRINNEPYFDHTIIKQVKNPSFILVVVNDQRGYYLNQLENAFISRKITLYSDESNIVVTEVNAKSKNIGISSGVASAGRNTVSGLGVGVNKGRTTGTITEKSIDLENTHASCIFYLDCYSWQFKIVSAETKELLAKGRVHNDVDVEVNEIYKKFAIQEQGLEKK